jgi:hypothetical protein
MLYAPKAKKCTSCENGTADVASSSCCGCGGKNRNYVIDRNVYKCSFSIRQGGELTVEENNEKILRETSVRTNKAMTAGYTNNTTGIIIKKLVVPSKKEKIVDSKVNEIMRCILISHSQNYANAIMSIYIDKSVFTVMLMGKGAKFCLNKSCYHTSQTVFLRVRKCHGENVRCESSMFCWSKKAILGKFGVSCRNFQSHSKFLSLDDSRYLNSVIIKYDSSSPPFAPLRRG